ncbi:hypothetical protein F8388_003587 [Cannabis sativa]|uniref:PGG domain-containing protein n=1 Tax=Cannabis sativa TaxID=3483 RepID=A0A7J6EMF7_CANSA|nr:hypothetical protein F8388_003587 [Cannabis sativa]
MESISIEDGEYSNHENTLNFLNAVKSDNIDWIRDLISFSSSSSLQALIETNNRNNGDTPLHVAVMLGNLEVVKLILDNMNIKIIRDLLQKPNKRRNTVLHEAVKNRNLDIVKLLLEKDSSLVNFNNEDGESPLFLAIDREFYEIAFHILSKIINNVKGILSQEKGSWSGRNGLNVMHAAVIRNKEGQDEHGWTPLHYAAHLNEFGLVNKFLSKHSLICCIQDNEGMSPLHIAAKNVSVEALESLKEGSGSYRYKMFELLDNNNQTALHVAVESKNTFSIKRRFLVKKMLSFEECNYIINWKDKDGNTCFHLAAKSSIMLFTWLMMAVDTNYFCGKRSLESVRDLNGDDDNKLVLSSDIPKEKEMLVSFQPKQQRNNRDIMNVNLIVATIIVSITFAAGIHIPGGYNNDGNPILQENSSFRRFMTFNSLAFGFSSASVFLTFVSVLYNTTLRKRFPKSTSLYLFVVVLCLNIASIASSIWAYLMSTKFLNLVSEPSFTDGVVLASCLIKPLVASLVAEVAQTISIMVEIVEAIHDNMEEEELKPD